MGKWATYQKRGGLTIPPVDAPVLRGTSDTELAWEWSGGDPDHWNIYNGPGPTGPWVLFDFAPGTDRSWAGGIASTWYVIIGVDGSDNPVTPQSNAAQTLT